MCDSEGCAAVCQCGSVFVKRTVPVGGGWTQMRRTAFPLEIESSETKYIEETLSSMREQCEGNSGRFSNKGMQILKYIYIYMRVDSTFMQLACTTTIVVTFHNPL